MTDDELVALWEKVMGFSPSAEQALGLLIAEHALNVVRAARETNPGMSMDELEAALLAAVAGAEADYERAVRRHGT